MFAMPGIRAFALSAKQGSEGVSFDEHGVFVGKEDAERPAES